MRAGFLDGQSAGAVGQGLGGDAVAGLGPLGLAERPVGIKSDTLAFDVDLRRRLPAAPDGLVGDPRIVGGHPGRLVVEKNAYDFLGNVAVDQPAGEGVPPLMGCQVDGAAVLIADVAGRQPLRELLPVAASEIRRVPETFACGRGKRQGVPSGQRARTRCCWSRMAA